ncbi:MAG: STAS domain-containing protein [Verrucomicrobia bacterium]|nr:STAS domain-containing protein [Verrucomicrobiota bacterium]
MDGITKGISVNTTGTDVHVRIVGRGTFQNGQPLRRCAMEMLERGCSQIFVDLGQCQGMDSTFLGVLAGIGLRLAQGGKGGKVHVINVSARNVELLQTLGLDRLFDVNFIGRDQTGHAFPEESSFQMLPDSDLMETAKGLNKFDTANFMLEAHGNLIKADPRNAPKFQDLTKFLRDKVGDQPPSQNPHS